MTTFPLGNSAVQISPERETYNALRLKYQGLAEKAKKDFADRFDERFKDMDQLFKNCEDVAQKYRDDAIDEAIRDLVARSIMDIDDEHFLNQYLMPHLSWGYDCDEINDKYLEIVLKAEELDSYRIARRENRGAVMGGGFGFEGAAIGIVGATAANMAIELVHGLFNLGAKALSTIGDMQKKLTLYSNPHTRNHLADSIYRLIFQVHLALVDAVNSRQPSRLFGNVSGEDGEKAKGLFENISKGRIIGEEADACLIQALGLNPYEPSLYSLWFDRHGDVDGQLEHLSQYFGVQDVSNYKHEKVLRHKDRLKFSTPEECKESLDSLEQYARSVGCQDIADERKNILALADHLDHKRRTVNGVVYETLKAAQIAKLQWEEEQSRIERERLRELHAHPESKQSFVPPPPLKSKLFWFFALFAIGMLIGMLVVAVNE